VTVFEIVGEINTNTNKQLQAEAERSIAAGTHDLLLDLEQVTYISSAGLRAIHTIFKLLSAAPDPSPGNASAGMFKSPHFKLLNPSSAVRKTLNMTGFDLFLDIHTDLDEAVASF
jgi:anti-anti-sigma regulatory factor